MNQTKSPEKEVKTNINSLLDEQINKLETTFNKIAEDLRQLKERQQEIEDNLRNKALNSSSEETVLSNNKKRHSDVIENSEEPTAKKKKKSKKESIENGHEMIKHEETTINYLESNQSKEMHFENSNTTPYNSQNPRKKKNKKSKKEAIENGHEMIKHEETTINNLETNRSKEMHFENSNTTSYNSQNPSVSYNNFPQNNFAKFPPNDFPRNDNFHYNRSNVFRKDRFHYYNQNFNNNNSKTQNEKFYNTSRQKEFTQKDWRKEKNQLKDALKSGTLRLNFNGANIASITGYGERVYSS